MGSGISSSLPHKELDGTAIAKNYLSSNLQAYWQHRNVRLSLGCYWLGTQAEYRSESIPNRYFHEKTHTVIRNNRSMVVVGVSWNSIPARRKKTSRASSTTPTPIPASSNNPYYIHIT